MFYFKTLANKPLPFNLRSFVISKEQRFLAATEKSPEPHNSCGMLQKLHSPSPLLSTPSFRRSSGFWLRLRNPVSQGHCQMFYFKTLANKPLPFNLRSFVISKEQRFLAATEKSPEPHNSCGMLQKFHSPSPLLSISVISKEQRFLAATEKSPEVQDSCHRHQKLHSPSPLVSTPSFRRSSGFWLRLRNPPNRITVVACFKSSILLLHS